MADLHFLFCKWRPLFFILCLAGTQFFYFTGRQCRSVTNSNNNSSIHPMPIVFNLHSNKYEETDQHPYINPNRLAFRPNESFYQTHHIQKRQPNTETVHVWYDGESVIDMKKYMLKPHQLPIAEEVLLDNTDIKDKVLPTEVEIRSLFSYEDVAFNKYMLNATAAQELRIDLPVGKTQPKLCLNKTYSSLLDPNIKVSIIIPFHHELWVVLLRCLHGIVRRSNLSLIHEIILIDDRSEETNLRGPLVRYLHKFPKARLLRMAEREGLIRARMAAARKATGNILIFMDAHVEVSHGWLEPLLDVIIKDRKVVAIPTVDYINPKTMQYHHVYYRTRGSFGWELDYVWKDVNKDIFYDQDVEPFSSGTMIGCVFAVERNAFFEFGGYDESMRIWGGENLEIAFRTWMCGGSLKVVPCSHVGHIYRTILPYNFTQATLYQNLQRVADVWMDDYKDIYFRTTGHEFIFNREDMESIQLRQQLRKDLKCKDFTWYLENVTPEVVVPQNDSLFFGQLRNLGSRFCLSVNVSTHALYFDYCTLYDRHQQFTYTTDNKVKHNSMCLTIDDSFKQASLQECKINRAHGDWVYNYLSSSKANFNKRLVGVDRRKPYATLQLKDSDTCFGKDGNKVNSTINMEPCDVNNPLQYWIFTHMLHNRR